MYYLKSFILGICLMANTIIGQNYSGFGGYGLGVYPIDWSSLNSKMTNLEIGEFNNSMVFHGGRGGSKVYKNIYIGGLGFGGQSRLADAAGNVNRKVEINLGMGGVYIESSRKLIKNIELITGSAIMWGVIDIQVTRDGGVNNWTNIWESYSNPANDVTPTHSFITTVSNSFTMIYPYASLRYPILPWFGLEGSVGYFQTFYDSNEWSVTGTQEIGLSKPIYRISMVFGG